MKLTTTLLAGLLTLLSLSAGATDPENKETIARVLPSKEEGFVKVFYMNPSEKKVEIKFYGDKGLITRDVVRASKYENGFIKVYDLNKLETGDYTIEISDNGMTVTYPISFDENKNTVWARQWDNFSQNNQIVSSNK